MEKFTNLKGIAAPFNFINVDNALKNQTPSESHWKRYKGNIRFNRMD